MRETIEQVKVTRGCRMGRSMFSSIWYADDAVLIAGSKSDVHSNEYYKFNEAYERYNIKIADVKTKSITYFHEPCRCKLLINDKIIEEVIEIGYLGTKFGSNNKADVEVEHQLTKGNRIAGMSE